MKKILQFLVNNFVWYLGYVTNFLTKEKNNKEKSLCIIRTDAIGDFVLFTPALKYLRKKYHDYKITLILQDRIKGLAENCPYIDNIITFNEKKYRRNLFYKLRFLLKIRNGAFEIVINPVYSRERIIDEMVLWMGAKESIGWDTDSPNMTEREKQRGDKVYTKLFKSKLNKFTHELKRNKEFLENLRIKVDSFPPQNFYGTKEKENIDTIFKQFNLDGKQIFAIIPGALNSYRQWEAEKWKNLMNGIISITENPIFLIVGSKSDIGIIQINDNNSLSKFTINLCGNFNLNELAPLFERCVLVLGNETGPLHIAIASGVPTIAILGGGHFGRFMPYGDSNKNRFVYKKMNCFQCDWQCIHPEKRCITEIAVNEVFKEVEDILNLKNKN